MMITNQPVTCRSVQCDEIYCLVGGSEGRLKIEAARVRYELQLEGKEVLRQARKRRMRLAEVYDSGNYGLPEAIWNGNHDQSALILQ